MDNEEKTYQAKFERFRIQPTYQNEYVDVFVKTSIPFDDENLDEFIQLFWDELFLFHSNWSCGKPLINGVGWSSAMMVDGRIREVII